MLLLYAVRKNEHVGPFDRYPSGPSRLQQILVRRGKLLSLDDVGVVAHHEESEPVGDVLPVAAGKRLGHDVAQHRRVEILEQALPVERLDAVGAGLEHVGLVAPRAGFGQGAADDLLGRAAPMVDPDSVLLLERGRERLAVGDRHGAVEQDLALLLRPFDEPLVAVGALVQVDPAMRRCRTGRRLRERARGKAGERGGEAG